MDKQAPQRILIILLGAIGDVTRALPLAVRIKRGWPEAKLFWAVEPRSADLLHGHRSLDGVIVFDRPRGLPAFRAFLRQIRDRRFDLVLDLQRHFKSGVVSFASRAPTRIGFARANSKEFNWLFNTAFIPAVENFSLKLDHYQLFGDLLGLPRDEPLEFGLEFSQEELKHAEDLLLNGRPKSKGWVALILGSTWRSRLWPIEHYRSLAEGLLDEYGITPVLLGGPAERESAARLEQELGGRSINLAGSTSLRQTAAVLKLCQAAVAPDSGPMHISAAVRTPVISLWGATTPRRSAPFGGESFVLQSAVGCAGCYRRLCPGLATLCMDEITPQAVLAGVRQALQGGQVL